MKIILFGTGDHYHKFKDWFYDEDIVCLLDNNEQKQNTIIDGKKVLAPEIGIRLEYEKICIVSVYYEAIKKQLVSLGVLEEDIVHCSELYKYPEMLRLDRTVQCIDKYGQKVCAIKGKSKSVLLMSHDLDFNGATLALYYVACILKDNDYDVWFASWTDGKLKTFLLEREISIIIDPRLQIDVCSRIEWLESFQNIFCNTLLYYKLLSDRDYEKKYLWWLHEPELFYQSVDKSILSTIKADNLKIYAVGDIARNAFIKNCSHMEVEELLYGIPDVTLQNDCQTIHLKIEIVTVGTVQEYKGQDILVDAIKHLPEKYREKIHVSIIGGNNSKYYDSVKVSAESVGDIVDFFPPVAREEVYQYYQNADIYICPSRQDCMPVVVAESMMRSLPSIVSDATGIAPYVKQGGGLLFQSGNSLDLAEKIKWCVDNQERLKAMGICARKQYDKFFSINAFEKSILKIVNDFFNI